MISTSVMRLKPDGQDLRLDSRKRGGGAATPKSISRMIGLLLEAVIFSMMSQRETKGNNARLIKK